MTKILVIRDKVGVWIASDGKMIKESTEKTFKLDAEKFSNVSNKIDSGVVGCAGSYYMSSTLRNVMANIKYKDLIVAPDFSIASEQEIRKFFEEFIKFYITKKEQINNICLTDYGLKELCINFLYVDKNRLVRANIDLKGVAKDILIQTFDQDKRYIMSLGSGGRFASEYATKYIWSGYSMIEILKNSILYALKKDVYSGGNIQINASPARQNEIPSSKAL